MGTIINLASLGSVPGVIRPYETKHIQPFTISGSSGEQAFNSNVVSVTVAYGQTNNVSDTADDGDDTDGETEDDED